MSALALLIQLAPVAGFAVWLFIIRPYCLRNGAGFTPGITITATAWVDWQIASELATERQDTKIIRFCKLFFLLQLPVIIGVPLSLLALLF